MSFKFYFIYPISEHIVWDVHRILILLEEVIQSLFREQEEAILVRKREIARHAFVQDVVIFIRLIGKFLFAWSFTRLDDTTNRTVQKTYILALMLYVSNIYFYCQLYTNRDEVFEYTVRSRLLMH